MLIDVVTIFPDYFAPLGVSLLGKARERQLLEVRVHDLRAWTTDVHRSVDDTPYGGGPGMVMRPEPWAAALTALVTAGGPAGTPGMNALAERLRRVRVCCGDWSRVCGPAPTVKMGLTGVFLDPPYADTANRDSELYAVDSLTVAHEVREWAIEHGDDQKMRICLAGYEGEHQMPESWECVEWKASGGYGSQRLGGDNENAAKERLWFSPNCLKPNANRMKQRELLEAAL